MTHIKSFNESVNEGIRDKMTPKPKEDVIKSLEKLSPYKALATARKHGVDEAIKICLERTKPINAKLIQDTKKYNKKNLHDFLDFVCEWVDENDGRSYDMDLYDRFKDITTSLSDKLEEGEEWEDDEGNHGMEEDSVEESIYSDITIKAYKQLGTSALSVTDDASLMEKIGIPVSIVPGSEDNIKITTKMDLKKATTD